MGKFLRQLNFILVWNRFPKKGKDLPTATLFYLSFFPIWDQRLFFRSLKELVLFCKGVFRSYLKYPNESKYFIIEDCAEVNGIAYNGIVTGDCIIIAKLAAILKPANVLAKVIKSRSQL